MEIRWWLSDVPGRFKGIITVPDDSIEYDIINTVKAEVLDRLDWGWEKVEEDTLPWPLRSVGPVGKTPGKFSRLEMWGNGAGTVRAKCGGPPMNFIGRIAVYRCDFITAV
jgi:hypothetical protein